MALALLPNIPQKVVVHKSHVRRTKQLCFNFRLWGHRNIGISLTLKIGAKQRFIYRPLIVIPQPKMENFIDLTAEDSPVKPSQSQSSSNLPPPVPAAAVQNASRRVLPQSISGMQQGWQQQQPMANGMANGMLPAQAAVPGRVLPLSMQQQMLIQQAGLMHQNQQFQQYQYPPQYPQYQPPVMVPRPVVPYQQPQPQAQQQYRQPQPYYYAPQTTITFELANATEFRVRSEGGEPGRDVVPLMRRVRGFRFDRAKNAILFPLGTSFVTHHRDPLTELLQLPSPLIYSLLLRISLRILSSFFLTYHDPIGTIHIYQPNTRPCPMR